MHIVSEAQILASENCRRWAKKSVSPLDRDGPAGQTQKVLWVLAAGRRKSELH